MIRIVQSSVKVPPIEFNFTIPMMTKVSTMTTILIQINSMMLLLGQTTIIPHHQMTDFGTYDATQTTPSRTSTLRSIVQPIRL